MSSVETPITPDIEEILNKILAKLDKMEARLDRMIDKMDAVIDRMEANTIEYSYRHAKENRFGKMIGG